jgi:hypothetical protein
MPKPKDEGFYPAYETHAKTLRTWLVAYGVGAPVVFLSNEKLWSLLRDAGLAPYLAISFLAGVAIQVGVTAINKMVMWALYYGESRPEYRRRRRYRFADTLSEQLWLDVAADFATIAAFGVGTYCAFKAVAA